MLLEIIFTKKIKGCKFELSIKKGEPVVNGVKIIEVIIRGGFGISEILKIPIPWILRIGKSLHLVDRVKNSRIIISLL